jgi:HTH-type transcriptional regulator, sugar sensing transcriptional regulator
MKEKLIELGFTENEAKIYLLLLKTGKLTPSEIAEKLGMHRTYVFDILKTLIERGNITAIIIDGKKKYSPIDPKEISRKIKTKLDEFNSILPSLEEIYKTTKTDLKVELFQGVKIYKKLLEDFINQVKERDEVLSFGVDEGEFEKMEPIYIRKYFNTLTKKNVKEKIIIRKGNKKFKYKNVEYKEIDEKYIGKTSYFIHQNWVYLFLFGINNYLIKIESDNIANTYRKQFSLLWKIAK